MKRFLLGATSLLVLSSCLDTALPPVPPPPSPGSIQGTVVFAVPGRAELQPAAKATISLLGTGLQTTSDDEGRFVLGGVSQTNGLLVLRLENAGVIRQRMLRLEDLGAGFARDISLGQVVLSRNALIRGRIALSDQAAHRRRRERARR